MDVAPVIDGGHLDAVDEANPVRACRHPRLGQPRECVVVGDAHHAQAGVRRERDERRRTATGRRKP